MAKPVFEVLSLGNWNLVRIDGELDMATAERFRTHMQSVTDKEPAGLVLDLNRVAFIDSTGLGVLVGVAKRMRLCESDFRIVCNQAHLLELFELTRLDEVFAIFADYAHALSDLDLDAALLAKLDEEAAMP